MCYILYVQAPWLHGSNRPGINLSFVKDIIKTPAEKSK